MRLIETVPEAKLQPLEIKLELRKLYLQHRTKPLTFHPQPPLASLLDAKVSLYVLSIYRFVLSLHVAGV